MSTDPHTLIADLVLHLRRQLGIGERFVPIGDVLRRLGPAAGTLGTVDAPAAASAPEVAR